MTISLPAASGSSCGSTACAPITAAIVSKLWKRIGNYGFRVTAASQEPVSRSGNHEVLLSVFPAECDGSRIGAGIELGHPFPVFEWKARKRLSSVGPINTHPLEVLASVTSS